MSRRGWGQEQNGKQERTAVFEVFPLNVLHRGGQDLFCF